MTHTPEIAAATLVIASLTSWITDEDWNRLVGPWGGFLVSILLCAILLRHSAKRIKREDQREDERMRREEARAEKESVERERRHKESIAAAEAAAAKYEGLTREVMAIQVETAKVMMRLSKSNEALHGEMKVRPCLAHSGFSFNNPEDESSTV